MFQGLKYQPTGGADHLGEGGLRLREGGRRALTPWGPTLRGQIEAGRAVVVSASAPQMRMAKSFMVIESLRRDLLDVEKS